MYSLILANIRSEKSLSEPNDLRDLNFLLRSDLGKVSGYLQ